MGENHQENIMKCLQAWHSFTLKQGDALKKGDLAELERLTKITGALQTRFNELTVNMKPVKLDRAGLKLLKEIHALQTAFIEELDKGAQMIHRTIGKLRKNSTSLKGYRRPSSHAPRFKSERT